MCIQKVEDTFHVMTLFKCLREEPSRQRTYPCSCYRNANILDCSRVWAVWIGVGYVVKEILGSVLQLTVTANFPGLVILFNLIMEEIYSSETSVLARLTRRHIPEDDIFHMTTRSILYCAHAKSKWLICRTFALSAAVGVGDQHTRHGSFRPRPSCLTASSSYANRENIRVSMGYLN
jgi:hypothetical protein